MKSVGVHIRRLHTKPTWCLSKGSTTSPLRPQTGMLMAWSFSPRYSPNSDNRSQITDRTKNLKKIGKKYKLHLRVITRVRCGPSGLNIPLSYLRNSFCSRHEILYLKISSKSPFVENLLSCISINNDDSNAYRCCPSNSPAAEFRVPSELRILRLRRPCRAPISKSLGSCAGVI